MVHNTINPPVDCFYGAFLLVLFLSFSRILTSVILLNRAPIVEKNIIILTMMKNKVNSNTVKYPNLSKTENCSLSYIINLTFMLNRCYIKLSPVNILEMVFVFIEILFKILLFKGGVLIYAGHCIEFYNLKWLFSM